MAKKSASKSKPARSASKKSTASKSTASKSTAKKSTASTKRGSAAKSSASTKSLPPAGSSRRKTTKKAAPTKKTKVVAASKSGSKNDSKGMSRTAMVATALGVAATAAAGFVAVRAASGKARKVFHLMPHEKGWQVKKAAADRPELTRETKKEALDAGRDVARKHEPSQLVVHRSDGTIQSAATYGE